jgi:aminoacrylate peracid reductase
VKADNVVYVSGILAIGPEGETLAVGDAGEQARLVLEAIKDIVEAAGGSMADVVTFNSIFLSDLANYAAMNEVYKTYFPESYPARYCIRADLVRPEFLIEISSIAHLPK